MSVKKYAGDYIAGISNFTNPEYALGSEDNACAYASLVGGKKYLYLKDFGFAFSNDPTEVFLDLKVITTQTSEYLDIAVWDGAMWNWIGYIHHPTDLKKKCIDSYFHGEKDILSIIDTATKLNNVQVQLELNTGGAGGHGTELWTCFVDALYIRAIEGVGVGGGIQYSDGLVSVLT